MPLRPTFTRIAGLGAAWWAARKLFGFHLTTKHWAPIILLCRRSIGKNGAWQTDKPTAALKQVEATAEYGVSNAKGTYTISV